MSTRRLLALLTASLFVATESPAALIQQTAVATTSTLAFGPHAMPTFSTAGGQTTMATGVVLNPLVLSGLLTPSFGHTGGTVGHLSFGGTGGITPGTPVGPGGVGGPLTPTAGSAFQPFPFAGAAAPVAEHRGSVFNPFPFEGATAPLGFVGGVAGPGAAPYRLSDTGASHGPGGGETGGAGPPAGTHAGLPTIQSTVTLNGQSTSHLLVTIGPLQNAQSAGATLIENPEPSSAGLLVLGLTGLAYWLRRRHGGPALRHPAGR